MYYYKSEKSTDLEREQSIRQAIIQIHAKYAFYGSRRIKVELQDNFKVKVNRKKIKKIMQEGGMVAIYPKKKFNTSEPNKADKHYPYLLKDMEISRVNQVWSTDITYIKLKQGMAYLVAVIDWRTRKIMGMGSYKQHR